MLIKTLLWSWTKLSSVGAEGGQNAGRDGMDPKFMLCSIQEYSLLVSKREIKNRFEIMIVQKTVIRLKLQYFLSFIPIKTD